MFKEGDRVYYKDGGPNDTGTVIGIIWGQCKTCGSDHIKEYQVKWDKGPEDELVGEFEPKQLELIK